MGLHGEPERLKIRIAAPPVDGEANDEVVRFLAKIIGVPRSAVVLVRGEGSRQKDLWIKGIADLNALEQTLMANSSPMVN